MTIDTGPYAHLGLPATQLLEDLADLAAVALAETPMGLPADRGLWHSQPVEDCCDFLYLWIREWVPINGAGQFPNQVTTVDRCRHVVFSPRVVLSLRRPCSPEPGEGGAVDIEDEHATASGLIVDAQALFCGIPELWLPRIHETFPNARIFYSAAVTTGEATNCAGLDWPMLLEFDGCKAGCGG